MHHLNVYKTGLGDTAVFTFPFNIQPCPSWRRPRYKVSNLRSPVPHPKLQTCLNTKQDEYTAKTGGVFRVNAVCVSAIITGIMNLCTVKEKTSGLHHYEAKSSLGHWR